MSTVSIIIPVHNEEAALPRCLDSVLAGRHADVEVIVVDDGSSDGSGAILDAYAGRDARVRPIHQANAGVSAARNAGLAAATGKYVQFVDSDDWIEAEMTGTLLGHLERENADLAACGWKTIYADAPGAAPRWSGRFPSGGLATGADYLARCRDQAHWTAFCSSWNKLYRLELIRRKRIAFRPGMRSAEDSLFNLGYAAACRRVFIDNGQYYVYMLERAIGGSGAAERFDPGIADGVLMVCRELARLLENRLGENELVELKRHLAGQIVTAAVKLCRRDSTLSREETRAALRFLSTRPDVLDWLAVYRPGPGQSRLVPFFMRRGWCRPLFLAGRRRANKRWPPDSA